jgi:hypothetical protein
VSAGLPPRPRIFPQGDTKPDTAAMPTRSNEPEPPRSPANAAPPLWRSRRLWHPIGYAFTGLWMLGVLLVTGGNSRNPLFDYIFVVPLATWILGLIVAALIKRRLGNAGATARSGRDGGH